MEVNIKKNKKSLYENKSNINNKIKDLIKFLKKDPFLILILVLFIIFTVYWSYFAVMRIYAFNAHVYDLGIAMQKAWMFINDPNQLFPGGYPNLILIVLFPIFLPKNFFLIVIFQAIFVSLSVFPLYGIGKSLLKNNLAAFLISTSYFLNPYLIGAYLADFHYQVFFIPFFFLGYYFYIKDKLYLSYIFFIFAGIVRFPYILFIVLFSLILLIDNVFRRLKKHDNLKTMKFSLLLFISSLSILLFYLLLWTNGNILNINNIYNIFAGQSHFSTYGNQNLSPIPPAFLSIDNKIFVLMIVVSPFLWLPFLSKKFIFLLLPYLYILFLANSWVYEFPNILFSQYEALIIPFLYLGTIDALSKFPDKYQIDIKPKNFLKKIKIV
ncbi:MAG: DUF2079 domain-containing protein, partial [Candidatus Nanopusillus acidilobi]